MLGAKALAVALMAMLLVPAAGATPGKGNGNGQGPPASVGVGGEAKSKQTPPQAERGQARKAENAARKIARRAAREAARGDDGRARPNPARICKAEREEMGDEAFAEEHGVNDNGANAFGKCVSKEARERDGAGSGDEGASPETDDPTVIGSAREASAFAEALAFFRLVMQSMRELI
jgi:hypothetical protein